MRANREKGDAIRKEVRPARRETPEMSNCET